MPLTEELRALEQYRKSNPQLTDLSDNQLADAVESQYPGTFKELQGASSLYKLAGRVENTFGDLGEKTSSLLGDRPGVSPLLRVPGRAAGMVVQSAPEIALQLAGGKLAGRLKSFIPAGLASIGSGASQYTRTKAAGGGPAEAAGAGASSTAALPLSLIGASVGKKFGPVGRIAGAAVGGLAADALEIASPLMFGSADEKERAQQWLADPVNIGSLALANSLDVSYDVMKERGEAARENIQKKRAESEDIYKGDTLPEYAGRLRAIPADQRTELETQRLARFDEMAGRQAKYSRAQVIENERRSVEAKLAAIPGLNLYTVPESSATMAAQFKMMQAGKKKAVLVPTGSAFSVRPHLDSPMFKRVKTKLGEFYYDAGKTNDAEIQTAVENDTVGEVLGYGVPFKPANPTGKVIVLRSPRGIEKAAVVVDDATEAQVRAKLQELADEGDIVRDERIERTLALRKARQSQVTSYSLKEEKVRYIDELEAQTELANTPPEKIAQLREALRSPNVTVQYSVWDKEMIPAGMDRAAQIDLIDTTDATKRNSASTNRKLLSALGMDLPPVPDSLPSGRYTLDQIRQAHGQGSNFSLSDPWSNNLFDRLAKAVEPRGPGQGSQFTLDKTGAMNGKGLLRSVQKWTPPDIYEHLKAQGIETILRNDKVNFNRFSEWLRQNTPELEVKKLEPSGPNVGTQRLAVLQHELETRGYVPLLEDGEVFVTYEGEDYRYNDPYLPREVLTLASEYNALMTDPADPDSHMGDAATGRYGVEPIKVSEMDRPVDILVRVPMAKTVKELDPRTGESYDYQAQGSLFLGPHFGDSDVNVVASVRGYMQGDTFLVFEVQSDWAQTVAKKMKPIPGLDADLQDPRMDRIRAEEGRKLNHPLLRSYETLALKTAIRHALEQGATKIAIVDPETAMMVEGHDGQFDRTEFVNFDSESEARHYANQSGGKVIENGITGRWQVVPSPSQEKGMRQHYGQSIPNIARKLTKDRGSARAFGRFTARGPSEYFGGKANITGLEFDLKNVDEVELNRTFSIFEMAEQGRFEQNFFPNLTLEMELERAKKDGKIYTTEEFLNKVLAGQQVDREILFKLVSSIVRQPKLIRGINLDPINNIRVWGESSNKDGISVNLQNTPEGAYGVALHELSHSTIQDLQWSNPALYNELTDFANGFTVDQRFSMLSDLADVAGVKDLDLDYLSGRKFDPAHKDTARKNMMEFTGAVVEMLAKSTYRDNAVNPTVSKYLSYLPYSFQRFLTHLMKKVRGLFGSGYPSVQHMLNPEAALRLQKVVDTISKKAFDTDELSGKLLEQLKKTDGFNPDLFISDLPYRRDPDFSQPMVRAFSSASPEVRDFSLNFLKESKLVNKVKDFYEENFLGGLFRTRLKPETTGHFLALHHYRSRITQKELRHMAVLGQDASGQLSLETALDNWDKYEKMLTKSSRGRTVLGKMSSVFEKDNNTRERLRKERPNQPVQDTDLTTVEQMQSEFGLEKDDAEMVKKMYKTLRAVADQTYRDLETTDIYNTARLFFTQNNKQSLEGALQKTQMLQLFVDQIGEVRAERTYYEEELARANKLAEPDAAYNAEVQAQIEPLVQQEQQLKAELEMRIRQLYQSDILFDPTPGNDLFINQVSEVMIKLAEHRVRTQFIMRDAGYAPMTRRGKFLVRVFDTVDGQPIDGTVAEMHGFDTQKEVDKFLAKRGFPVGYFEVIDKEKMHERAKLYTPNQIQSVRAKAKLDFASMLEKMRIEARKNPRPNQEQFFEIVNELEAGFRPLQAEYADVISDKGDKFVQRRWNVPGFDKNDYLPNIFEYINFRTVLGEKQITRAKSKLELARPEIQSDPKLLRRMSMETDYVLNKSMEAAGVRKFIFNWYLGASIRHIAQNAFQIPLVGIPQMVADGTGYFRAQGYFLNASRLAAQYSLKGTTGDKVIDAMLKQADAEGVTLPSALEMFSPQTDEIQAGLDRAASLAGGKRTIGTTFKAGASELGNGLGRIMRSSAVAGEMANRRVTFIMSALKSRHDMKGKWNVAKAFNDANLFTDLVNFVGDKSNRPGFLIKTGNAWPHSPLMVWSALQTFTLNQLGQVYTFAKKGFSGSKTDQKALATSFAHLLILAGAMGLVGMETIEQLFEQATGISLKTAIRRKFVESLTDGLGFGAEGVERLADGVEGGLPSLLGIDASGSVGLGAPFFRFQAEHEPTALDVIGPLGGVVQKGVKMLDAATANPWSPSEWMSTINKVARAGAPQALNQFLRMSDAINENAYFDTAGKPVVKGLDNDSVAALGLGFTPTQVSNRREVKSQDYKNEKRRNEQYNSAADGIAQALYRFETTGDPKWSELAQDMFEKFVRERGGAQNRSSFIDSITERVAQFRSPQDQAPSLTSLEDFESIRAAYPGSREEFPSRLGSTMEGLQHSAELGQGDDTLRRLTNLTQGVRSQVLYDSLVQAGLPPPVASLVSQRGNEGIRKLLEIQALSSP